MGADEVGGVFLAVVVLALVCIPLLRWLEGAGDQHLGVAQVLLFGIRVLLVRAIDSAVQCIGMVENFLARVGHGRLRSECAGGQVSGKAGAAAIAMIMACGAGIATKERGKSAGGAIVGWPVRAKNLRQTGKISRQ